MAAVVGSGILHFVEDGGGGEFGEGTERPGVADFAVAVEDVDEGVGADAVFGGEFSDGVGEVAPGDGVVGLEFSQLADGVPVDADDDEGFAGEFFHHFGGEGDRVFCFGDGAAPEEEEDDFAGVIGEVEGASGGVDAGEVRGGSSFGEVADDVEFVFGDFGDRSVFEDDVRAC